MKLNIFFTLITLLNFTRTFGQEVIWTKQTKISEVIAFEKKINPKVEFLAQNVSLSKEYYPLADKYKVTNPVTVKRESLGHLPIYAEYFYTAADSILRFVSYDWERGRYDNFFDKQKIWKEERGKFEDYNKEYERIKRILVAQFGLPKSTDKSAKTISSEGSNYLNRNTLWETDHVHAELNMIFAETTYRVRLTLYWKK